MMGTAEKTAALFHYFSIEEHVPENRLLRLIDRHVDLSVVRNKLAGYYSEVGRPSIDPEVLFRMLLIGYLYGIASERRLVEEVSIHSPLVGSPVWGLIRASRITRPSRRIATGASRSRRVSATCSRWWLHDVSKPGWCKVSVCRWMAARSRPTPAARASSSAKSYTSSPRWRARSRIPCGARSAEHKRRRHAGFSRDARLQGAAERDLRDGP